MVVKNIGYCLNVQVRIKIDFDDINLKYVYYVFNKLSFDILSCKNEYNYIVVL